MRRRFTTNKFLTKTFEINNYLTIEALENDLTVSFTSDIAYGIDGQGWMLLKAGKKTQSINAGQTLSFKGNLTPNGNIGIGKFIISKKCNLKGNCMSMIFGNNAADNYSLSDKDNAFYGLFRDCTNIVNVSNNFLPATTLSNHCYGSMFYGCTSLTTAPELPATTLTYMCYSGMFLKCTALTIAPELPSIALAQSCYSDMFLGCTALTTAPELPATTLIERCYSSMFYNCTSLTTAPTLSAMTLANYCCWNMFKNCTSLVNAPELPATTLASYCYYDMFDGCTALTTAPELPATALADYCYAYMFNMCSSLTFAPTLPATTLTSYCYSNMFEGCSSLTTAPELPATTLVDNCYRNMFYDCTKLNYIKMLATDISAGGCLHYWIWGVSSTGTFVKNSAMTNLPDAAITNDYSGFPYKWTVVNDGEE